MGDVTCSEPGCDRPVCARGLCNTDYARYRREGRPLPPTRFEDSRARLKAKCAVDDCPRAGSGRQPYCKRHYENLRRCGALLPIWDRPLEVRLHEIGWTVTESGCWEWKGACNPSGYGKLTAKRLGIVGGLVHRLMHELRKGSIPDGQIVRHTCDNPPCCNPDHLLAGTKRDNAQDMMERGRSWSQTRKRCKNDHDLTLPGATRRRDCGNGFVADKCVECERDRKRRYQERKRAAGTNLTA